MNKFMTGDVVKLKKNKGLLSVMKKGNIGTVTKITKPYKIQISWNIGVTTSYHKKHQLILVNRTLKNHIKQIIRRNDGRDNEN